MNTPIIDFVKEYSDRKAVRLHMPAHKGKNILGVETFDITEIDDADNLFDANGIIAESQNNATKLFESGQTYYSTEGSSLSIRAMLSIALLGKKNPVVIAGRNAHKSFITASALIDFDIKWIYGAFISCQITADDLEYTIKELDKLPDAVYITSPDYLGVILNIEELSSVCTKYGIPLLVDNAHGAYLKFLPTSMHPIDLGADMCCDSAHKTLPVLTGGGYLHISKNAPKSYFENATSMLSLFASTSPSYLIMQSLDYANKYISENKNDFAHCQIQVEALKQYLKDIGFYLIGNEPFKITIDALACGITGKNLYFELKKKGIVCEFFDIVYVTAMFSTFTTDEEFERVKVAFSQIEHTARHELSNVLFVMPSVKKMSIREAYFSNKKTVYIEDSVGKVLAEPSVSCPPAVPIAVCGELISNYQVELFKLYNIKTVKVVSEE